MRALLVAGAALLLGACTTQKAAGPAPAAPLAAPPASGRPAPAPALPAIVPVGAPSALPGFAATDAALAAFRRACPKLAARTDRSGLTIAADWAAACADPETSPAAFFDRHFTAVRIGDGRGLATGYFEPEIAGVRTATAGAAPVYARPADLVELDLGAFVADLSGRKISGRVAAGSFIPYFTRAEIDAGALAGRGLELAFAADPVELFFLQIQGSGRLRFADGTVLRIGYAGQNGRPYVPIGRLLRARGLVDKPDMAAIIAWIRAHPAEGTALMQENPSYVFFRPLPSGDDGPPGALGVPLAARANAAVDPRAIPFGAPLFATTSIDGAPARLLLVAADTGGAIRGPNRIDIFFGHGEAARATAGRLAAPVDVVVLLPRPAAARLPRQP